MNAESSSSTGNTETPSQENEAPSGEYNDATTSRMTRLICVRVCLVSHDSSEIILICRFTVQVENSCAA